MIHCSSSSPPVCQPAALIDNGINIDIDIDIAQGKRGDTYLL